MNAAHIQVCNEEKTQDSLKESWNTFENMGYIKKVF